MMAFNDRSLDDYIDVPQRIADFRARYPEGSLQPHKEFEIRQVEGVDKGGKQFTATFVVYTAAAYRTPDDQRPGIGMAWEVFPGRTPYTLGSELMNAETSAWGRAIVAALASDSKRGVSSREEVRNRAAEQDGDSWENAKPASRNGQQQAAPDGGEWETEAPDGERAELAQVIADEACQARAVSEMSNLHARADDKGLLGITVRNPATGGEGLLKAYLAWRRNQLSAEARALAELRKAGQAAGLEGEALDARVQELVGAGIEAATVTQMKEAAAKLATAGAAS